MAARTWVATVEKNFSDVSGWDGGASVPSGADTLTYGPNDGNCIIDNVGSWTGGKITVGSDYSGVITQQSGINIVLAGAGSFVQQGGTFTCHASATFTAASFSVTGGTFNQGGAFVSTTFAVGAGVYVGSSATMSTTTVTLNSASGNVTATSGIWTATGTWNASAALTWSANGGTVAFSGGTQTVTAANSPFNFCTVNKTGNLTISTGTVPFGANPTTTCGTNQISVTGTLTFSGNWVHTGTLAVNSGGTVTGTSTPTLALTQSLTLDSGLTSWPTTMPITYNGTTATTVTDTGAKSTGTTTVSKSGSLSPIFTVAASTTVALGASPTLTIGSGVNAVVITGTITATGAVVCTGAGHFSVDASGVAFSGASSIAFGGGLTVTSGGTFPTIPLSFSGAATITATATTLGTCTVSVGSAAFTVAASTTVPLGASPTTVSGFFTVAGTVTVSGVWAFTGALALPSGGTISGSLTEISWSSFSGAGYDLDLDNGGAWPTGVKVKVNLLHGGAAMTLRAGTITFGDLEIIQSAAVGASTSFVLTGNSNTFGAISFVSGGTWFHGITFTAGTVCSSFSVNGGSPTAYCEVVGGSLHSTGSTEITCQYLHIQNSTVDASPEWNAFNSVDLGGNVNWGFVSSETGVYRQRSRGHRIVPRYS